MAYSGFATPGGTASFRDSFAVQSDSGHFREWDDLWLSSIGIGTYLGEADEETDAAYRDSVARAVRGGCNVIDSAINYRFQRSERCVGEALASLLGAGDARRREADGGTDALPFSGSADPPVGLASVLVAIS